MEGMNVIMAHIQFHNRLYLREIFWLYTIDIWTSVCIWAVRTDRERELFYQRDSAYLAFTNFKLIDKEFWLPEKTGRLVTSLALRVWFW